MIPSLVLYSCSLKTNDFTSDFDAFIREVKSFYAYIDADHLDLKAIQNFYRPKFAMVENNEHLVELLENVVGEFWDFHSFLNTNNDHSPRLIPTGSDVYAVWQGGHAVVAQVRVDSIAQRAGIRAGDKIVRVEGKNAKDAAEKWFGVRKPTTAISDWGWEWALNSALASRWDSSREWTIRRRNQELKFKLKTTEVPQSKSRLTSKQLQGNLLLLRPEDSLTQFDLIKDFEAKIDQMRQSKGIIIDLRNTPTGGNTTVARGILGLFVSQRLPYQRHVLDERDTKTVRDWIEYVTPRVSNPIRTPMVVLVGRWTGSMGEGMAIGFDGIGRAKVVGTKMAGLRGAIGSFELPKSKIQVTFPTERLYHVNGTPRHEWVPRHRITTDQLAESKSDPWIEKAAKILRR